MAPSTRTNYALINTTANGGLQTEPLDTTDTSIRIIVATIKSKPIDTATTKSSGASTNVHGVYHSMEHHNEHFDDSSAADTVLSPLADLDITMEDIDEPQEVDGRPKQRARKGKQSLCHHNITSFKCVYMMTSAWLKVFFCVSPKPTVIKSAPTKHKKGFKHALSQDIVSKRRAGMNRASMTLQVDMLWRMPTILWKWLEKERLKSQNVIGEIKPVRK